MAPQRERKQRHSDRRSLAFALAASLVVHSIPLVTVIRFPFPASPANFEIRTRTTEFGLEQALPGARNVPPQPAQPQPAQPQPQPQPPQPRPRPRVERPRVAEIPQVPDLRLREPNIAPRPTQRLDPGANTAERPAPRPSTPSVANTVSDLAPMVPQGSLFTIAIRMDRIRATPYARSVRRVFNSIRDWREMLGGASIDFVDDLDRVVLAASNPFGANGQAPDWYVLAKASGHSDRRLRAAVEAMADHDRPLAPSPVHPPSDEDDASAGGDRRSTRSDDDASSGSSVDGGARRDIWTHRDGARITTLNRYGASRSYVLLPDGTAAISLASQMDGLLAALARRPPSAADDSAQGVALVLEAEGIRSAIVEVPTMHGPFPLPRRAVISVTPDTSAQGGADLVARFEYDSAAQARSAREEWDYVRGRWAAMIEAIPGVAALRIGAGLFGRRSVVDHVQAALTALQFRAGGNAVTGRVHVTDEQLRSLLDSAPMLTSLSR
ncbi:MAG: hypothetical protein U0269_02900 [Polyangiales bacterium]